MKPEFCTYTSLYLGFFLAPWSVFFQTVVQEF